MVVGYLEEEEDEEQEPEKEEEGKGREAEATAALPNPINKFRIAGKAVIMQARKPAGGRGVRNFDLVRAESGWCYRVVVRGESKMGN